MCLIKNKFNNENCIKYNVKSEIISFNKYKYILNKNYFNNLRWINPIYGAL
ncbi:MAG: hypothetical protein K0S93_1663 [Nitrososphaeraceae archaeon]|nr:hypothetical protein [Nitrososphaeraceae archaeon]